MFIVICFFFAHVGNQLNLGDDDSSFLTAPNSFIVGKLRGKQLEVCSGNSQYPKECHPNGEWNFKAGDVIDYTWGITGDPGQEGELVYAIVPSAFV